MKIENIEEAQNLAKMLAKFQKLIDDQVFIGSYTARTVTAYVHVDYHPMGNRALVSSELEMDHNELRSFVATKIQDIKNKLMMLGVEIDGKVEE